MNTEEFSSNFDTALQAYASSGVDLTFDEYEKSVFLTEAQNQIVLNLYKTFEQSEESREYLSSLVKTFNGTPIEEENVELLNISPYKSYKVELEDTLMFIIYEQCKLGEDAQCFKDNIVSIQPITHDDVYKILQNPFRCPNNRRVLRLNIDSYIELISKYCISDYKVRYLKRPQPIILTKLEDTNIETLQVVTECEVNPVLHQQIVNLAVQLALQSKLKNNNKAQ